MTDCTTTPCAYMSPFTWSLCWATLVPIPTFELTTSFEVPTSKLEDTVTFPDTVRFEDIIELPVTPKSPK